MKSHVRDRLVALVSSAILVVAFSACGGDGGGGPSAPTTSGTRGQTVLVEAMARAAAYARAVSQSDSEESYHEMPPFENRSESHTASVSEGGVAAQATAGIDVTLDHDPTSGELRSFTFSAQASGSNSSTNEDTAGCGDANSGAWIVFDVIGEPVGYSVSATIINETPDAEDVTVRIREADGNGGWKFPHVFVGIASFATTGVLAPGTYMVQVWSEAGACSQRVTTANSSLSGVFTITDVESRTASPRGSAPGADRPSL